MGCDSFVLLLFLELIGLFNCHVVKFFGVKDVTTFQALDVFCVLVTGDNSDPRVFAGGSHCGIRVSVDSLSADCNDLFCIFKRQIGESSDAKAVPQQDLGSLEMRT